MTNIEAFLASVSKHGVAEQTKIKATECGHMFNLLADKNYDNGVIVAKNAYQYDDVYSVKDSTDFAGTIIDVAKNGNFIVHVDDPGDGLLVLTPPFSYVTEPSRFAAEDQFYNATGSIMRAYELVKDDEFAASAECFDTTPSKGQTVTVTATTRKLHSA